VSSDWDQGNPLFGDWSGIPRGEEARYVETPVGYLCIECGERIEAADAGEMQPFLKLDGVRWWAVHRECILLGIVGHQYGVCRCTDYAGAKTRHEAALILTARMDLDR
jgi:hypothetical protein